MQLFRENRLAAGLLLAFLAALLWSGNYIVARGVHDKISPVGLAFFRWMTATLVLFPIAFKKLKPEWRRLLPHWKLMAATALLGVTLFNTFIYVAGKYSSAMNLAIIGTTAAPVFVMILSFLFLKERLAPNQVAGTLLCIAGILLLISKGHLAQLRGFRISVGDVWILTAALSFAIYTLLVRKKPKDVSALTYLFVLFFLGFLFLIPAYLADVYTGASVTFTPDLLFIFLYLGIGASVGAFLCWNIAIQKIGAIKTSLFANLIPVFSSIEAVLILGEKGSPVTIISLALILSGLLLANYKHLKKEKKKGAAIAASANVP